MKQFMALLLLKRICGAADPRCKTKPQEKTTVALIMTEMR
jgi:hypothetical protein